MEIIQSKPQLALEFVEKEFVDKAIEFSRKFECICDEVENCEDCPICDGCCQIINGQPSRLVDFFQSLLDNSI